MLNLSTTEFFFHTANFRSASTDGALVIACDPFQSQLQNKLDELFGDNERQSETAVMLRSPAAKDEQKSKAKKRSKTNNHRRQLSASTAAGRKGRMELEDTLQMRLEKRARKRAFDVREFVYAVIAKVFQH